MRIVLATAATLSRVGPIPLSEAGLAPIPAALRATLAVSRSSVMIARMTARLTARRLTE